MEGYGVKTAAVVVLGRHRTWKKFGWDLFCVVQSWQVYERELVIVINTNLRFFYYEL